MLTSKMQHGMLLQISASRSWYITYFKWWSLMLVWQADI